jgi:integrase
LARTGPQQPDDLDFTAPGRGPARAGNFRKRVWGPTIMAIGLPGFTFHSLRHSSVGFMVAAGTHPLVIQRRTGHASVSTTRDSACSGRPWRSDGDAQGVQAAVD